MTEPVIGIDLGTTYSLVAALEADGPVVLRNALDSILTPSVVGLSDRGELLVGEPARARLGTHPELTVAAFKRAMGTDQTFDLGGRSFRPEELSAMVLSAIRQDAEDALHAKIERVVVTVPAYFGELQRRATRDACEIAGLRVERLINEPTAAALAFGMADLDRECRAIIIDLGGGTFDVTVLEIIDGVVEIQASAGDSRLGGEDFSQALFELLLERLGSPIDRLDLHARARMRQAAERAKVELSSSSHARVLLSELDSGQAGLESFETEISAQDAARAQAPVLSRMMTPIRLALRDAGLDMSDIDHVLLVGGATRMPIVRSFLMELFEQELRDDLPPDEAVALGAALTAGLERGAKHVEDLVVTDVAPFTLGVETVAQAGRTFVEGHFTPILERGTVLPASRVVTVQTVHNRQRRVNIRIYQGEFADCSRNQRLGELVVDGIPRRPAGQESLDIRYTYDLNGILEVDAVVNSTGKKASFVLEQAPGRLSPEQVRKARQDMQRLKFHPREALPNVTALSWADELFAETTGQQRQILGQLVAEFRVALETQDQGMISSARQELLACIEYLKANR